MDDAQVMGELERLLARLYSSECTNEERAEISKVLDSFSQQEDVWKHCVYLLQNSSSQYAILYGLHVIESLIVHTWSALPPGDKLNLKQFLLEYLINKYALLPSSFRNKVVHVFVLIGQSDWPHVYPDFLENILQLVKSEGTVLLGLSLLQTTSEELATPKSDNVSSKRRKELVSLLSQHVSAILSMLVDILTSGLWLHPSLMQAGQSQSMTQMAPSSNSPLFVLQLPLEVCGSALNCLNHLFSWIPLSVGLTPHLVDIVFKYASLGCLSGSDSSGQCGRLGSLAMDCVNELLVKNCVPQEFELFLMKLFDQSFGLLQRLTNGIEGEGNDFARLDDRYLSKCGDFFDYFVSSHLKRVEFNPTFPVLEFLALFYKYTFKQPEVDSFCVCLMTWNVFLDHLVLMSRDTHTDLSPHSSKHYERYKDILLSMTGSVLEKVQFHYNTVELSDIDDDTIDENETEWQSFLRQNLEFVGKVSELFPMEVLQMILPLFEKYSQVYLSLTQLVSEQGKDRVLSVNMGSQCESLHAVLKDLTTVLQALGRLAEHFSGEHFTERLQETQQLMNQFCVIAKYSTDNKLFNVETPMPEVLDQGFIEVHSQVLGTIQAYQHWLSQFHLATLQGNQSQEVLSYFIFSAIESAMPLISHDVPEKISLSACRLFLSLASTIRPHYLSQHPLVQAQLLKASKGDLSCLPIRVSVMLYQALVAMLVLPWPSITEESQNWDKRYSELCKVIYGVTGPYQCHLSSTHFNQDPVLQDQAKPVIKRALYFLHEILSFLSGEHKKAKSLLYQSISSCVLETAQLFHTYIDQPDVLDELMGFFYTLFKTLHAQVGTSLTDQITQTFMSLLTKDHLEKTILVEDSAGNRVVVRFIDLLKLLIQDVSAANKPFLPNIISFAMKQLYPALVNKDLPDVKFSFYSLLFQILLNNWRYFYPSNVLVKMDGYEERVEHEEELLAIMESFGQSFVQSDINIFRENLTALETLNEKKKLFSKSNFQSSMWEPFLNVLLQVLTQKTHDLLQDEISGLIYKLASVDVLKFHTEFLPKFIGTIPGLTQEQQLSLVEDYKIVEDLPSFTQNLNQLVTDLRYYFTINATLPSNSVKLS